MNKTIKRSSSSTQVRVNPKYSKTNTKLTPVNLDKNTDNIKTTRGVSTRKTFSAKNKTNDSDNIKFDINNLIDLCNDPNLLNQEPIILEKLDNILDNLNDIKSVIKDNTMKKPSKLNK